MPITTDFAAQKVVDEKLRAEFTRHRNRIKALKIRRNSYCAVNQLPSDILTEIFMTFKLLVGECSLSSRTFEWTTLLHVCDAWYHQIMNTPRFWSVVDLNLPFASRMMALSKAAPLQVTVRMPPDAGESLWSLVAKALSPRHRLQELTIHLPDPKAFSRAFNSVPPNSTAPYLEHLTIDVANVEGKFSGYFWTHLPSLRSLSLANTPLPWETHSMPNLVILDIGTQQYDHRPTISWLLTALKYMPHIQTISVSRLRGSNVDPRAPPITLPCLKNLHVGSDDASTLSILNLLSPPALVAAEFRYKDVDTKTLLATDLSALRRTVSRVMSTSTSITSVSISFNDMFRIEVYVNGDIDNLEQRSLLCHFPLVPQAGLHVFLELCELIPLSKITHLALCGFTVHTVDPVKFTFIPSCPKIATLQIDSCNVSILRSLFKPHDAPCPPNPELKCIRFQDVCFHNREGRKNGFFFSLERILRERTEHMMPIDTVTFSRCDIGSSALMDIKKLVSVRLSRR